MLKLSYIVPTEFIGPSEMAGDFTMVLSHLLERDSQNKYEEAVKKAGLPIVLDNGCFEKGYPEGVDSLLKKASRIKASYVIAPDSLYDKNGTKKALEIFLYIKKRINSRVKTTAVIQADNVRDYLALYSDFNDDPEVDAIGISYLAIMKVFSKEREKRGITEQRIRMIDLMLEKEKPNKPFHLLGIGESYRDVFYAYNKGIDVINDSSAAFINGLNKNKIEGLNFKVKPKEKLDFSIKSLDRERSDIIKYNINEIKKYANKSKKNN